ncbi:MAG: DUF6603 domain-containing protein [bacterium]
MNLLFGKVTISFSFSVGGSLHVLGPPLHGTVTAELGPISLTVPFGPDEDPDPKYLKWDAFRLKYLQGDDSTAAVVDAQAGAGLPTEPPAGARPRARGSSRGGSGRSSRCPPTPACPPRPWSPSARSPIWAARSC